MRLKNHTVIVTGASSGLGKAMATEFVSEGANVACAARTEGRLEHTVTDMSGSAGEAIAVPTDIRSWDEITNLVETTRNTFGPVDLLVNNAAVRQGYMANATTRNPVVDVPVDVVDAILETNLRATMLCSKAVLPEMLDREQGILIHMSSTVGAGKEADGGSARRAPYAASKAGVESLHDSLTDELEGTGVKSIALIPPSGAVHTEIKEEWGANETDSAHADSSVIAKPAVQLAAGDGEHGGRYRATPDGEGFTTYSRCP